MTGLAEFLLARIAEDEAAAQRADGEAWQHRSLMRHPTSRQSVYADGHEIAEVEHLYGWHIARWDPARVLAECEAKRAIIGSRQSFQTVADSAATLETKLTGAGAVAALDVALKFLALPYADHPDFREEWRP